MRHFAGWMKNSFNLLVSQVIARGGMFVLTIIIARMLGESTLGKFAALYAMFAILLPISEWGQQTFLTRQLAGDTDTNKRKSVVNSLLIAALFSGAAGFVLFVCGSFIIVQDLFASLWLALALIAMSFSYVLKAVFRANDKWNLESNANALDRSLMLLLAFAMIYFGAGLAGVCFAIFCGQMLSLMYVVYTVCVELKDSDKSGEETSIRENFKSGFSLMLTGLFAIIYVKSDIVILSIFRPENEVGGYAAAYNLIVIAGVLAYVLLWSQFPGLSKMSKSEVIRWNNKTFILLALLGLTVFSVFNIIREPVYTLVYGCCGGVVFLPFLFAAEGVNFLNYVMGTTQRALYNEGVLAWLMGVGAITNIILNFILIPKIGAQGAAAATFVTYTIVAVGNVLMLSERKALHLLMLGTVGSILLVMGLYGYSVKV